MAKHLFSIAVIGTLMFLCVTADAQTYQIKTSQKIRTNTVTKHTTGTFEVKATPLAAEDNIGDPKIGRLSLEKKFSGGIAGTGRGQMLGYQSDDKTKGGYVAIEQITGTLDGRKGTFALQPHGTMDGDNYLINVYVVPGSGTGELSGISGNFTIKMEKGAHYYDFEYSLPAAK